MKASVEFYRDVLGMEVLYGGEGAAFSSLRAGGADRAILNLEEGKTTTCWGRLIFHVMSRMWMRSGEASKDWDSTLTDRKMLLGASGISTCSTRMGMSCRLRGRIIVGQMHFIKTSGDMYEAVVNTVLRSSLGWRSTSLPAHV